MTKRVLVMNGQRLLQTEREGEWVISKVDKAGSIKPGIYPLALAAPADKGKSYDGPVLHADRDHVFQQVGKSTVRHDARDFHVPLEPGRHAEISYENGKALVAQPAAKRSRGVRR